MTSLQVALYQSLISYASVLFCFAGNLTILNFTANLKPYKMAIKKQYLKSKPVCKVTFEVSAKEANSISVVGDFNEWNAEATPLKKLKNKKFKGIVSLEKGNSYEFKYLVDGTYVNEENPDALKWNALCQC